MCLPVLFICLPGWVLVAGLAAGLFPAGLSPTCFHVSPTSFHLFPRLFLVVGFRARLSPTCFHVSPNSFHLSPRLGACGRVPGWLVSHFLSFVSHFFSFVSQAGCLWAGSWLARLQLPFICLPLLFIPQKVYCEWSPWCWMVWFPAGLSPTSFHLSPSSFHLSPRLGACGRVPGWLVSHFFSFVSQFFICLRGGVLVVGLPAGLSPTSFHLSPTSFHLSPSSFHLSPTLLVGLDGLVGFPAGLSPTSFHLSPSSFHLSQVGVPGWLVSHFLSFPNSHAMGSCKTNRRTGAVGSPSELVGGWCPGHVLMASGSCDAGVPVSRSCFDCDPIML